MMRSFQSRGLSCICLLLILCQLTGCSKPPRKLELTATGSLLINGQPAANARITLSPEADDVPALTGLVKSDGTFSLEVYDEDLKNFDPPGDPEGTYHVLVRLPRDPTVVLSPDRLGGVLANPKISKKQITLERGENKLDPIQFDGVQISN